MREIERERELFDRAIGRTDKVSDEGSLDETTEEISIPDYAMRDLDTLEEASSRLEREDEAPSPSHMEAREAARILGVNQRAVRNLINRKALEGKRDGEGAAARLLISRASVERLRSEQQREQRVPGG